MKSLPTLVKVSVSAIMILTAAASCIFGGDSTPPTGASSIYDFTMTDIDGKPVSLSNYRGKVVMIVNVASKCGFTPQYAGLQKIYEHYKEQGFVILGFPANDFLRQEPASNSEIKTFCSLTYNVTFPMFAKITVKGGKTDPLYKYLTKENSDKKLNGKIGWNFTKFLVNKGGVVANRFPSKTTPESEEVTAAIETLLSGK